MSTFKVQTVLYYTVGVVLFGLFFLILRPFLLPLFWAAVFAIMLTPAKDWLTQKTKNADIASVITMFAGLLAALIPVIIIFGTAVDSLEEFYRGIRAWFPQFSMDMSGMKTRLSLLGHTDFDKNAFVISIMDLFYSSLAEILNYLWKNLSNIGTNVVLFVLKMFVMLYALYFFIRDGLLIIEKVRNIMPSDRKLATMLLHRFSNVAVAVLKATVIMGTLQGVIGGLLFYFAGFGGAIIWGFLIAIATLVPSISCAVIWLPVGLAMAVIGDVRATVVILMGGAFIITPIDYFLKPALIGRDIGVHPLLIFLSSLGGIMLIGFSGLIVGPIISALVISVFETLTEKEPT